MNTIEKEFIENILAPYIISKGDICGILLTGSRAQQLQHRFSDYDFCCLTGCNSYGYFESKKLQNNNCEMLFHSEEELQQFFLEDIRCEVAIRIYMYASGIPIYDPMNKMIAWKQYASKLYQKGLPPLSQEGYLQLQHNLEISYNKVRGLPTSYLPSFLLGELANLQRDWFTMNRYWKVKPAFRDGFIKKYDPYFYNLLVTAFTASNLSHKKDVILNIVSYLKSRLEFFYPQYRQKLLYNTESVAANRNLIF
jgi:hypothetical protein